MELVVQEAASLLEFPCFRRLLASFAPHPCAPVCGAPVAPSACERLLWGMAFAFVGMSGGPEHAQLSSMMAACCVSL